MAGACPDHHVDWNGQKYQKPFGEILGAELHEQRDEKFSQAGNQQTWVVGQVHMIKVALCISVGSGLIKTLHRQDIECIIRARVWELRNEMRW